MNDREDPRTTANLMIAAGAILATLCGLCTGGIVFSPESENRVLAPFAWIIGGGPTVCGLVLIGLGLKRRFDLARKDRR